MKKLAILSLVILLNGCALIDVYRMAKWDNNEYMLANQIHTQAQLGVGNCNNKKAVLPYVDDMYNKSVELKNYSAGIDRNTEAVRMTTELLAITKGLKDRYYSGDEVSQKFCELKFGNIEGSTDIIQKALGAKPR
jgi:hypothetical protein